MINKNSAIKKCPICNKSFKLFLIIERPKPDQEYDEVTIKCQDCGQIGTVDIKILTIPKSLKIDIPDKEKIREELRKAHVDYDCGYAKI